MGGFVVFPDGRAWAPNNRTYDEGIEHVAAVLNQRTDDRALAAWLLDQRISVVGVGSIDLRELTPTNQSRLLDAIEAAFAVHDMPETIDWYRDRETGFQLLSHVAKAYRCGQPPDQLNPNMRALIPSRGHQAGPGWDAQTR